MSNYFIYTIVFTDASYVINLYIGVKIMFKVVLSYLLIINLLGFLITLIDKQRAIHKEWRIPEKTLIGISFFGGAIGMLLGMSSFRHKTKHKKFTIGVPFILLMHICLIILYFKAY